MSRWVGQVLPHTRIRRLDLRGNHLTEYLTDLSAFTGVANRSPYESALRAPAGKRNDFFGARAASKSEEVARYAGVALI